MSDQERALREALQGRAAEVPVGQADEGGLRHRLAVIRRRRRRAGAAGAVLVVVVALSVAALVGPDGGEDGNVIAGPGPSTTTTLVDPSTTTSPAPVAPAPTLAPGTSGTAPATTAPATAVPRTTSTTAPLPPVPDDALWPPPGSPTTFSSPGSAASDFTRRFLGMGTPQLGAARVSGDRATVDVRPLPTGGPTSVVSLRRIDRRGWVVVGCAASRIFVDQPAPSAQVTSPLTVRGRAQAYEGTVTVQVRGDGATAPLGQSFGTGGGTEVLPYEATVTFTRPPTPRGTLVVSEPRADTDTQGPAAATVVRIRF